MGGQANLSRDLRRAVSMPDATERRLTRAEKQMLVNFRRIRPSASKTMTVLYLQKLGKSEADELA